MAAAYPRSRRRFLQGSLAVAGISLVAGCALPPAATAPPRRPARIGFLSRVSPAGSLEFEAFLDGLREHGWEPHSDPVFEYRFARSIEAQAAAAAELASLQVDLIVTVGNSFTQAARAASSNLPIVMALSTDPVGAGLVISLARPGRNVTGLATLSEYLGPKRLELLKDVLPGLARILVIWNPTGSDRSVEASRLQEAAGSLGVHFEVMAHRTALELGQLLEVVRARRDTAAIILDEPSSAGLATSVETAVARAPVAAIGVYGAFARAGGLLAYGPNEPQMFRRAATYVDKILKGAKPADLPVEQPTTFDLIVNLKTAQALGLTIPSSILQQATEVVQ